MPVTQEHAQRRSEEENTQANEGEGNKTAARRYNEGVKKTVQSEKVEEAAEAARVALDGPEAEGLARAEEQGKAPARRTSTSGDH